MQQIDAGEELLQITVCSALRSQYAILTCSDSAAKCGLLYWLLGSCLHFQPITPVARHSFADHRDGHHVTAGRREMADRGRGKGPKPPTRTCFSAHLTVTLNMLRCRSYARACITHMMLRLAPLLLYSRQLAMGHS